MNRIKIKNYLILSITFSLLIFTALYFKIFNGNTLIVTVPRENTPPADFEVFFGEYKLKRDTSPKNNFSTSDIWVDNKDKYFEIRPDDETSPEYYYIIEGNFLKSKGYEKTNYREIHILKIDKIHGAVFWFIHVITFLCIVLTIKQFFSIIFKHSRE